MKLSILFVAALCLSGCTSIDLAKGTAKSCGVIRTFDELSVTIDTNGVKTITVKGHTSDQAKSLGVVVDAAVKAAIQGAKP